MVMRLFGGGRARALVVLACFYASVWSVIAQAGGDDSGTLDVPPIMSPVANVYSYEEGYGDFESGEYDYYYYSRNDSMGGADLYEDGTAENYTLLAEGRYNQYPESKSVCMPPELDDNIEADYMKETSTHEQRRMLTLGELDSAPAKKAVMLAVEFYVERKNGTAYVEMTEIKSGCRQNCAKGELLFLVFDAKETLVCDLTAVNSTCTENTMRTVECRARVHFSPINAWYPFYTSCHPPEFYAIERNGVKIRYI